MSRTIIESYGSLRPETIRPINDQIMVKVLKNNESFGGIYLPKEEKSARCVGQVVAVGKGESSTYDGRRFGSYVKPGDVILTMGYIGQELWLNGTEYRIIREHGLWAKLIVEVDGGKMTITELYPMTHHVLVQLEEKDVL